MDCIRRTIHRCEKPITLTGLIPLNGSRITFSTTASQPQGPRITGVQYLRGLAPVFGGVLGPTSLLMGLSGCIDTWRSARLPDGTHVEESDPIWVIIPAAIAMVIGVVANLLLIAKLLDGRRHTYYLLNASITLWVLECNHCVCW